MAELTSTILIVDDEADDLEKLQDALRSLESELISIMDPHHVIDAVRESKPDVVLMDALLPGLSGFDLCREIKSDAELKTTQIIIITGVYLRDKHRQEAFKEFRADGFLTKPFRPPELQRLVARLLAKRTRRPQSSFLDRFGLSGSNKPGKRGFLDRLLGRPEREGAPVPEFAVRDQPSFAPEPEKVPSIPADEAKSSTDERAEASLRPAQEPPPQVEPEREREREREREHEPPPVPEPAPEPAGPHAHQTEPETETETEPEREPQPQPEPTPALEPVAETEPEPDGESQREPAQAKPVPKAENEAKALTEAKAESTVEETREPQGDTKAEPDAEAKPEPEDTAGPVPAAALDPETEPEPESESEPELGFTPVGPSEASSARESRAPIALASGEESPVNAAELQEILASQVEAARAEEEHPSAGPASATDVHEASSAPPEDEEPEPTAAELLAVPPAEHSHVTWRREWWSPDRVPEPDSKPDAPFRGQPESGPEAQAEPEPEPEGEPAPVAEPKQKPEREISAAEAQGPETVALPNRLDETLRSVDVPENVTAVALSSTAPTHESEPAPKQESEPEPDPDPETQALYTPAALPSPARPRPIGEVPVYDETEFPVELRRELSKCRRVEKPLTLILIEVDDLRQIVELLGKNFRELVLLHVAQAATASLREVDLVGLLDSTGRIAITAFASERYGGERIVDRLTKSLSKNPFRLGEALPPIVPVLSFGMATFPGDGDDMKSLLSKAESELRASSS